MGAAPWLRDGSFPLGAPGSPLQGQRSQGWLKQGPTLSVSPALLFQTYMLHDSLEHAQLFDLMRRMLEFDPCRRITFSEALLHPFFAGLSAEERLLCGRGASRDLSR